MKSPGWLRSPHGICQLAGERSEAVMEKGTEAALPGFQPPHAKAVFLRAPVSPSGETQVWRGTHP